MTASATVHAPTPSASHGTGHGSPHVYPDPTFGVGFLFLTLVLGILARNWLLRFRIPYTVIMLVFGFLLGVMEHNLAHVPALTGITETIRIWETMNPHLILYIFLPALIFESAFSVDFHIFRRSFSQVLLLAGPGVVLGTGLTALYCRLILSSYNWDWTTLLMFGSILSATDPVAVVALLKELGASERLSTLIEGESLMNDGTAMVFYLIFKDMVTGQVTRTAGEGVLFFLQLSLGGPVVGLVIGVVTSWILSTVLDDALTEISLTFVSAYCAFLLAEGTVLHTSGILACVALGVYMSYVGKTQICSSVEHYMHNFWEMIGYFMNTLIFVLSGVIMLDKITLGHHDIVAADYGLLFLLYLGLNLIRALMVLLLSPLLRRTGYGLEPKEALVLVYGGLRGAVGLALGLIVEQDPDIPRIVRDKVLFHVAGIATLTLLINGTTCGLLVNALGLTRMTQQGRRMYSKACLKLDAYTQEVVDRMKTDRFVSDADWPLVWRYLAVYSKGMYNARIERGVTRQGLADVPPNLLGRWLKYRNQFESEKEVLPGTCSFLKRTGQHCMRLCCKPCMGNDEENQGLHGQDGNSTGTRRNTFVQMMSAMESKGDLLRSPSRDESVMTPELKRAFYVEARHRFLALVRAKYWHALEEGMLGPVSFRLLYAAESIELDNGPDKVGPENRGVPLHEWEYLEKECTIPVWFDRVNSMPCARYLFRNYLNRHLGLVYDISINFVKAHEKAGHDAAFLSLAESAQIIQESRAGIKAAQQQINLITQTYPEIAQSLKTRRAAQAVLEKERLFIEEIYTHGEINEKEYGKMLSTNLSSKKKAALAPPSMEMPSPQRLLQDVPAFQSLPAETFEKLMSSARQVVFKEGQTIAALGKRCDTVYAVARGTVAVCTNSTPNNRDTRSKRRASTAAAAAAAAGAGAGAAGGEEEKGAGSSSGSSADGDGDDSLLPSSSSSSAAAAYTSRTIQQGGNVASRCGPCSLLGTLEMLMDLPHLTSLVCESAVLVFAWDKRDFRRLMLRHTALFDGMWKSAAVLVASTALSHFDHLSMTAVRSLIYEHSSVYIPRRALAQEDNATSAVVGVAGSSAEQCSPITINCGSAILMHGSVLKIGGSVPAAPLTAFNVLPPSAHPYTLTGDAVLIMVTEEGVFLHDEQQQHASRSASFRTLLDTQPDALASVTTPMLGSDAATPAAAAAGVSASATSRINTHRRKSVTIGRLYAEPRSEWAEEEESEDIRARRQSLGQPAGAAARQSFAAIPDDE